MTTPVCKLVKGARSIDLNDQTRFWLHQNFVPPAALLAPLWAGGTSANLDGATKEAETPQNREISFGVRLKGDSANDIRTWAARLNWLLAQAGDESEPLYLAFKPDSDTPEPLWGQGGAYLYYEIRDGSARLPSDYLSGAKLATDIDIAIGLTVAPFAVGLQQRLMSALGRLHEDVYGPADGISRGLHVGPSLTNLITNPVFGHSTWNNDWTADASLAASQNTDPDYLIPGTLSSAYLQSRAANQEYYQSINAGNTNTRVFIALMYLPDKGAPSSSDMQIFYNATLTTTFVELGNGLWLCSATAAGINAATNCGVQVKSGRAIYLCYFGTCATANIFYPFWGDNLGCAWSATAHDSSSTCTAGRARLPVAADTIDYQQGSVRIVWTPQQAYNAYANGNYYLLDAGSLDFYFNATSDLWTVTDGTNTLTVATTFAAHTPIVFHITWGPSGLALYVNGTLADSDSYAFPASASYVYLGTDSSAANHAMGVFNGFDIWRSPLTSTQVSNDYTNVTPLLSLADLPERKRVTCIPWLWTKDGDDVVDNYDAASVDNFTVIAGMPGSAEADTEYLAYAHTGGSNNQFDIDGGIYFSLFPLPVSFTPTLIPLLVDHSGTATTAADVGSAVETISVNTSAANPASNLTILRPDFLLGKKMYFYTRLSDAGATLTLAGTLKIGGVTITETYRAVTADATRRGYMLGSIDVPEAIRFSGASLISPTAWVSMKRTTAGAANVSLDYTNVFMGDLVLVKPAGATLGLTGVWIRLRGFVAGIESDTAYNHPASVTGDKALDLLPGVFNVLSVVRGLHGNANTISVTTTFSKVSVTPRYTLL